MSVTSGAQSSNWILIFDPSEISRKIRFPAMSSRTSRRARFPSFKSRIPEPFRLIGVATSSIWLVILNAYLTFTVLAFRNVSWTFRYTASGF